MQRNNLLSIFKNCDFSGRIADDNFEDKILSNLPEDFSYRFFFGASKLCIIPNGADYVIKIPFNSSWCASDEEYCEFQSGTSDNRFYWDYCLAEVLYYKEARKNAINRVFCKARLLGQVDDYPIYVQERAETYFNLHGEMTSDARTPRTREYCHKKGFSCFNPIWIADALEYYGEKKFNKIMSFIKSSQIGDLHDDNIGYIGPRPVLIDYSDFCE